MPRAHKSELLEGGDSGQDMWTQHAQISTWMLLSEYKKAEAIAEKQIDVLQRDRSTTDGQSMVLDSISLAHWYSMLGTIQYFMDDNSNSRKNYLVSLQIQRDAWGSLGGSTLQLPQIHRTLTLLDWLNTTLSPEHAEISVKLDTYKEEVESHMRQNLHKTENKPFLRRSARNANVAASVKVRNATSANDPTTQHSVRKRVISRPVTVLVDRRSRPPINSTLSVSSETQAATQSRAAHRSQPHSRAHGNSVVSGSVKVAYAANRLPPKPKPPQPSTSWS